MRTVSVASPQSGMRTRERPRRQLRKQSVSAAQRARRWSFFRRAQTPSTQVGLKLPSAMQSVSLAQYVAPGSSGWQEPEMLPKIPGAASQWKPRAQFAVTPLHSRRRRGERRSRARAA